MPILVPGVNPDRIALLDVQWRQCGWKGFITPLANCTTIGLVIALKPIYSAFGIAS